MADPDTRPGPADADLSERGIAAVFTNRRGVVASFDDHLGAGTVRDASTDEMWPFHCTRIAGGSRSIPVGSVVEFRVDLGPVGLEAVDVTNQP